MFDNIKAINYGFTGKLKGNPTLRKYFWVMLSAIIFTFIILAYNSFMSLNFYKRAFERFAGVDSIIVPLIVTIASAVIVYFLLSSFTGTMLDYIAGRSYKTEGHLPIFIGTLFALVGLMSLDIYANLQGVDYVAEITTVQVIEDDSRDIRSDLQKEIDGADSKLNDLLAGKLGGYGWRDKKGTFHLNQSGKKYQRALTSEKEKIRAQQELLMNNSLREREADKARFSKEVGVKQGVHNKLVYFAYAIAFLLCVIVNHYCDRAIIHVEGEPETSTETTQLQNLIAVIQQNPGQAAAAVAKKPEEGEQIGFKTIKPQVLEPAKIGKDNTELLTRILGRLENLENGKAIDRTVPKNLRNGKQFSSAYQPKNKSPKRNGKRVEGMESRNAILAAYKALKAAGKRATQAAISESTGISRKTVGNHVREMRREGIIT